MEVDSSREMLAELAGSGAGTNTRTNEHFSDDPVPMMNTVSSVENKSQPTGGQTSILSCTVLTSNETEMTDAGDKFDSDSKQVPNSLPVVNGDKMQAEDVSEIEENVTCAPNDDLKTEEKEEVGIVAVEPEAVVIEVEESNDGQKNNDATVKNPSSPSLNVSEREEVKMRPVETNLDEHEDNPSSSSSSPSALHIHLDEEKDESQSAISGEKDAADLEHLTGVMDSSDPPLPLISNVVSLSETAASSTFPSALGEAEASGEVGALTEDAGSDPSTGNNSNSNSSANNTRRATLRFKRGIEISFEVDQNGQPVTVTDAASSGANPSHSEHSTSQSKRARLDDDDATGSDSNLTNEPELSEMDGEGTANVLAKVQKDIRTLRFMAKQKEKEWNYILKLMKMKEELQAKLMRRREVLKITTAKRISANSSLPDVQKDHYVTYTSSSAANATSSSSSSGSQASNLQSLINQSLNSIMTQTKAHGGISSPKVNTTVVGSSHSGGATVSTPHMKHMHRQRPILPKPSNLQVNPDLQVWNTSNSIHGHPMSLDASSVSDAHAQQDRDGRYRSSTVSVQSLIADFRSGVESQLQAERDARNRQGTINVKSLIADYRAKHPEEIPTRGRRVRQQSKICGDPTSSNSPTPPPPQPNTSHMSHTEPSSMSFKDVLLQFAKMSSRQGHSAVDLMQLGGKDGGSGTLVTNSHGLMAGGSSSSGNNSSAAALQSLAAARNARSGNPSPSALVTAGSSSGSILHNALSSATGARVNPSFAPTLAQLLTNPAAEQQQPQQPQQPQQQQQPQPSPSPQQQILGPNNSTVAPSESLTLSNLLATVKQGNSTAGRGSSSSSHKLNHNNSHSSSGGGSGLAALSSGTGGASSGNARTSSSGPSSSTNGEVPKCQGCHERVAQFVCAGCSSQWYCSRECQVAAWEEHSENCVG